MDYGTMERLTQAQAKRIAGVKNLVVKFSNRLKESHALCYWDENPKAIYFNKKFVDLNITNDQALKELIIHECIHLIPGCHVHNKKFVSKCEKYGIKLYGYSTPINELKSDFATHCTKCEVYTRYYTKPRSTYCRLCGGKLKVFDFRDKK